MCSQSWRLVAIDTSKNDNLKAAFQRVLKALPGIVYEQDSVASSSIEVSNGQVGVDLRFQSDFAGIADRHLTLFIAERAGIDTTDATDIKGISRLRFECDANQAKRVVKMLEYASELAMAPLPSTTPLDTSALPILLSHALLAFESDYKNCRTQQLPSLAVCSNLLRVLNSKGVLQSDIEQKAVISTRTRKVVVKQCVSMGWIELHKRGSPRPKTFASLTKSGARVKSNGECRVRDVEDDWATRTPDTYRCLRKTLQQVVGNFHLKYPYFISGYGPGDDSLTGGLYVPQETSPVQVPAHGMEWPVVFRDKNESVGSLPLFSLLSQTLTDFALDYEGNRLGSLGHVLKLYRYIGNDGVELGSVRAKGKITGGGRSLHERHMNVVLEPGKPNNDSRMVYLTPKARRARDSYPFLVRTIEEEWVDRFGESTMSDLRLALEELDATLPRPLPDYPDTTSWMSPWFQPYLV